MGREGGTAGGAARARSGGLARDGLRHAGVGAAETSWTRIAL